MILRAFVAPGAPPVFFADNSLFTGCKRVAFLGSGAIGKHCVSLSPVARELNFAFMTILLLKVNLHFYEIIATVAAGE